MSIDFGTLVENPLRILPLLAGWAIKNRRCCGWSRGRVLARAWQNSVAGLAVLLAVVSFAFVVFGAAQMAGCTWSRNGQR